MRAVQRGVTTQNGAQTAPLQGLKIGGASQDRTDDLIVANDALSQLSYSPIWWWVIFVYFSSRPLISPIPVIL